MDLKRAMATCVAASMTTLAVAQDARPIWLKCEGRTLVEKKETNEKYYEPTSHIYRFSAATCELEEFDQKNKVLKPTGSVKCSADEVSADDSGKGLFLSNVKIDRRSLSLTYFFLAKQLSLFATETCVLTPPPSEIAKPRI